MFQYFGSVLCKLGNMKREIQESFCNGESGGILKMYNQQKSNEHGNIKIGNLKELHYTKTSVLK